MLVLLCIPIVCFNYWIDPLWCFSHSHRFNSQQIGFDERQQKSNLLAYQPGDYDALLIGSSRVVLFNQTHVTGYKAFNFAVNAMMPEEYAAYVSYARRHGAQKLKLIILGLDFFGSNDNFKGHGYQRPDMYFRNAEDPSYRFKALLTMDALNCSVKNIKQLYKATQHTYFNRENIKLVRPLSKRFKELELAKNLQDFDRHLYGSNYVFRDIKPFLRQLRDENSGVRIIAFTTPESLPVWRYQLKAGRLDDYLRWVDDIVEVFGSVNNFMGENELTADLDNFQDAHHLMPEVSSKLLGCLQQTSDKNADACSGNLVTRENYKAFAAGVRLRYGKLTN